LDLDVYCLYAHYQHKVHGDADPFTEDVSQSQPPQPPREEDAANVHPSRSTKEEEEESMSTRGGGGTNTHDTTTTTTTHDHKDPFTDEHWGQRAPPGWKPQLQQHWKQRFFSDTSTCSTDRIYHLARQYIQFYEFLVDNPFPPTMDVHMENATTTAAATSSSTTTTTPTTTGTYHQQYRINGVLIAVGVVDLLPQGFSSVYVFYDPDFSHTVAPLGKYTSLYEIEWTTQHGLPYYYLGYYVHSCIKMKYKADYKPSELLCPQTAVWVSADEAKRIIDQDSPERHCCVLYKSGSGTTSGGTTATKNYGTTTNHGTTSGIPPHLKIEVGIDRLVEWQELPDEATSVLQPFVEAFCQEAGPWVTSQVVMDFR
jgi:arginine-tRNA-protein transferase